MNTAICLREKAAEARAFDAIAERDMDESKLISELQALRRKQPDHVRTLQRLASLYKRHGTAGLARQACEHIVELIDEEKKRSGRTTIAFDANRVNRAVHDAMYDLADCHSLAAGDGQGEAHRAERSKAADRFVELIGLDERDPLKAGLRVASELLRAGRNTEAVDWIRRREREYPPYRYELALEAFRGGAWVHATLNLRRAMLANGYVAEHLWTGEEPPRLPWVERPGADIETASSYLRRYGDWWRSDPDALAWVRWYWEHPRTLAARSEYAALREQWSRGDTATRDQAAWDMDRCIGRQTVYEAEANVGTDTENPPWRPADRVFETR